MNRKKEPKELIEVLLREQRKRAPGGEDPLEGIEWGGLPDGLRDKVYHPPEQKEPLVDLLLSVEREKRRAKAEGSGAHAGEGGTPERPGLRERWDTWLEHTFGLLGRTCEVRVATVVAFAGASLFLIFMAYLYGFERGRMQDPPIAFTSFRGAPDELTIEGPSGAPRPQDVVTAKQEPGAGETSGAFDARKGSSAPGSPAPKAVAPKLPWVIRIVSVNATPKNQACAENLCVRLRQEGIPEPEVVTVDREGRKWLVVVAGGWPDYTKAQEALRTLKPKIEQVTGVEGFGPFRDPTAWQRP